MTGNRLLGELRGGLEKQPWWVTAVLAWADVMDERRLTAAVWGAVVLGAVARSGWRGRWRGRWRGGRRGGRARTGRRPEEGVNGSARGVGNRPENAREPAVGADR